MDPLHCISDNIVAQKSAPIPFHPTQLDAPVLHAFDNSHGFYNLRIRKVMSFHWPLNISNGSVLVCEHKKELLHTCIPLIHLTKRP